MSKKVFAINKRKKAGLMSLSPLFVFVFLYLGFSIAVGDFYKIPITVAFLSTSVYAIATMKEKRLEERLAVFSRGASSGNILLMIWIFILASIFAATAKSMGAIDATVNLTLKVLPSNMIVAGMFLASCFVSLSVGTSVGTVVALVPIAGGIAEMTNSSPSMITAVIVGGAFFGDNLSFISDTTIVATSTQGCKLSDKFKANIRIVLPAAIITLILYILIGHDIHSVSRIEHVDYIKILPYIVVLVTAIMGMNVLCTLLLGTILAAVIGMLYGSYDFFEWFSIMGEGMLGMSELIIVTLLAGGLLEVIKEGGGIDYLIGAMTRRINGKRGAELSIASLVSLVGLCTANNTVSIITVGGVAQKISQQYGVDPRKAASILDTFSCCVQGVIPYGAQLLMAAGLAGINPVSIIPYLYYTFILFVISILAIIFRYPKTYS